VTTGTTATRTTDQPAQAQQTALDQGTMQQPTPAVGISLSRLLVLGRVAARALRDDGLGFLMLWPRVQARVPGWLFGPDAWLLYELARRGPGQGAIVEIGSAWGRSTIYLARGSQRAGRERVYAIDPHTGDPSYLASGEHYGIWRADVPRPPAGEGFSTLPAFLANIQRFGVAGQVEPVVAASTTAAATLDPGPIRLLYIDGLHTYAAVRADIDDWVARVVTGGVIVFDDYFNASPEVGVRHAVTELLASGQVEPTLRTTGDHLLVWVIKR
jgi:predicted O-methyltransferase YrrM